MIWTIAWKNVWRNKLRSFVIILSISLGLFAGIFSWAFYNGWIQQAITSSIEVEISNIQLHHPKFLLNNEIQYNINNPDEIIDKIEQSPDVIAACKRTKVTAMASSAVTGAGVMINGIIKEKEERVTNLYSKIVKGTYFKKAARHPVVIGEKLAEKLKLNVNSKIVITVQSLSGDITYGAFKIVGIYKTDDTNFDQSNIFVLNEDLVDLIGFDEDKTSEIAVLLKKNELTDSVKDRFSEIFSSEINAKNIVVRSWSEIQPLLKMMNDWTVQWSLIFIVIILFALSFGIINTMLMVILERVREIGMLMAVGMNKLRIFNMIMMETVFLSITGGIIGIIISIITISYTGKQGINLTFLAEGINAWGYSAIVYPEVQGYVYGIIAVLVIITAMFSSIYPARRALKLNPAVAVRMEA